MALQAVLSAFRQLILDGIDLPATVLARESLFRSRFASLSDQEVEDLAKMEPSRLSLYTTSVFSAEGNILKNAFPLTLAALEAAWPAEWGGYSARALAQRIHRTAPWRGIHSMTFGESLISFIERDCGNIREAVPWLPEAANLEQAMLEIRRALNEPVRPQAESEIEKLSSLTVEQLLARNAHIPALLRCVTLEYDLLKARQEVLDGARLQPPALMRQRLVGARPHDYGVAFLEVSPEVSALLEQRRGQTVAFRDIAEAFVSGVDEQATSGEQQTFRVFFSLLRGLVSIGAVSV